MHAWTHFLWFAYVVMCLTVKLTLFTVLCLYAEV